MKHVSLMIVLLISGLCLAQKQSVAVSPSYGDTMEQVKLSLDKQEAKLAFKERRVNLLEKENELNMRSAMLERNFQDKMREVRDGNGQACPMRKAFPYRHVLAGIILLKLLGVCFLCYCAVNILLTILVCLDMKKRGTFNGLWVPLLLIAAIPVTALYALFRIGDNVKEKSA